MQRGADDESFNRDSIYRTFRTAIKKAEAEAEVAAVKCVIDASETKWQAAMTFLERKFPERWSRGERVEHSGTIEQPTIDLSVLTDAELDTLDTITAKIEGIKAPVH